MSRPALLSPRALFALAGASALAAVAAALVSQHVFNMQPCPWCVLQRLIFIAIGAVALLAAAVPAPGLQVSAAGLVTALGGANIASALWQHFVAAKSSSCNLTLADRIVSGLQLDVTIPPVFEVRANCSEAAVAMLGVPYEFWSLALTVALVAVVWWAVGWGRRRR